MSATSRNIPINSGILTNLLNLLFSLKRFPSTDNSIWEVISPKVDAHASKFPISYSSNLSDCRNFCMTYISLMELLIGVPVANTTPLFPLLMSLMYLHFNSISVAFCDGLLDMPDTFIFEKIGRFLKLWASSIYTASIPSSSKSRKSSLDSSFWSFFNPSSSVLIKLWSCLTVQLLLLAASRLCLWSTRVWIWSSVYFILLSFDIESLANCGWLIITAS